MLRKTVLTASLVAGAALSFSAPAQATWNWGCWGKKCPGTSTSGGTKVPEPGMLGLMGLGLAGLAVARRKSSRRR